MISFSKKCFLLCPLKRSRNNDKSVATSILSAQTVASDHCIPLKETRVLGEMSDSMSGRGNLQDEPRTSYRVRKQGSDSRGHVKGAQEAAGRVSLNQIWSNENIENIIIAIY